MRSRFTGILLQDHVFLSFFLTPSFLRSCRVDARWSKLTMFSTGVLSPDLARTPDVAQVVKRGNSSRARRGRSPLPPKLQAFAKRLSLSYIPSERPQSWQTVIAWKEPPPSTSPVIPEKGFSKRKPRHIPIVITQSVIKAVLKDIPDSPIYQDFDRQSSLIFGSISGEEQSSVSIASSSRRRHIPIVIPSYAQPYTFPHPYSLFPPTPSGSGRNTPHASPPSHYLCDPKPLKMYRSDASASTTSMLDSSTFAPSSNQMYTERVHPSPNSSRTGMNSSQSSLHRNISYESREEMDIHSRPRVGTTIPNSARYSPPTTQQTQTLGGTTNLSGLVCNIHRTTGKEPSGLVGASTTILGDKLYVFGGRKVSRRRNQLISALYELDLIRRHWTRVETQGQPPPPRYFHSVCALGDTKLICYGGMSPASTLQPDQKKTPPKQPNAKESQPDVVVLSDIHIYDVPTRTWTYITTEDTPQGRYAHCTAVLPSSASFASANAPLSAIQHNPAGSNPNQGSIGVALDGTGGAEMVVVGGQDSSNHYIEQINVFNLRSLTWTTTHTLGRSCGAYRSVIAPLLSMPASKIGTSSDRRDSIKESSRPSQQAGECPSMLIYSNYNFLDVKLELQVRLPDGSLSEKRMNSQFSPPGLRFPNGGVIDNHFVVSGTYLTSSKQEYALWALDLRTLTWSRIDAGGSVFAQGSWNRGILWPRRNTFVILGDRKRSLVEDYNHRRINFTNVCLVELEAFGLYDNPRRTWPTSGYPSMSSVSLPPSLMPKSSMFTPGGCPYSSAAVGLGEMAMNFRELADMDLLTIEGERVPVNSHLLARRWGPYFLQLIREGSSPSTTVIHNDNASSSSGADTLRPGGGLAPSANSRNSSITITPSMTTINAGHSSGANTLSPGVAHHIKPGPSSPTFEIPTPLTSPPSLRERILYLPHTLLTVQALVHYLYTSSLPPSSHPLCTPQILCSLLQLARPYGVDGLVEAVVERLHQALDGRNAAAVFNAAAMAAGGGQCKIPVSGIEGEPSIIKESIRLTPTQASDRQLDVIDRVNGITSDTTAGNESEDDRSSIVSGSAASNTTDASEVSVADGDAEDEIWSGGLSCVVGLQKRGLRGLMEGRRLREQGKSTGANGMSDAGRVGLGIA